MAGRPTSGDNLWRMLEDEGLFVDEDLQLILKAARSDNLVLLSSFGKDDKLKLEAFMSQTLHKLISKEKYVQYYGIYEEKPQLFRFVAGQEKQIDLIAKLCRKIISAGNLASKTSTNTGEALGEASNSQSTQKPAALSALISSQSPSQEGKKILQQKDILDKNINNYIKDNFEEELQVSSTVSEDGLGSYNAVVFCPVCESRKKIPKSGSRWNTSNFYLHLRTHVVKEPPTKARKIDSIIVKDSQGNNRQDQKKKTLTSKSGPVKRKSKSNSPISDSDDETEDDPNEVNNVEDSASNKENNLEVAPKEASSEGQEGNDASHENGGNF